MKPFLVLVIAIVGNLANAESGCNYERSKKDGITNDQLLVQSVESVCPELMDALLKNEKADDLYIATLDYTRKILGFLSLQVDMNKGADETDPASNVFKSEAAILNKFTNFLNEKCTDTAKDDVACKARKTNEDFLAKLKEKFNTALAEEQAEANDQEKRNSPTGLIDQACACDKFISLNQADIDKEKEVGKISGTVNVMTLNKAGNHIVELKKMKKAIATKYKSVAKKDLSKYKCTDMDSLTNPLLWGQGVPVRQNN